MISVQLRVECENKKFCIENGLKSQIEMTILLYPHK